MCGDFKKGPGERRDDGGAVPQAVEVAARRRGLAEMRCDIVTLRRVHEDGVGVVVDIT